MDTETGETLSGRRNRARKPTYTVVVSSGPMTSGPRYSVPNRTNLTYRAVRQRSGGGRGEGMFPTLGVRGGRVCDDVHSYSELAHRLRVNQRIQGSPRKQKQFGPGDGRGGVTCHWPDGADDCV